jgi:hypothetical protein
MKNAVLRARDHQLFFVVWLARAPADPAPSRRGTALEEDGLEAVILAAMA